MDAAGGVMANLVRMPVHQGSPLSREAFELFLIHEAKLLDDRRFRDWMELFAEDGAYWVPAAFNQESPFNHASLFYDDRALMKTRIDRLEHPRIHIQTPPSRTAHIIGNVLVDRIDEAKNEVEISSNMMMIEYREDNQRVFAGRQIHQLRRVGESYKIVLKRVNLINCDGVFDAMAVPI
jgi:3-phenylpropionate/cinnamic acid dioxygenase small subunit